MKFFIIYCVVCFGSVMPIFSQNSVMIDSLLQLLPQTKDTTKVRVLGELAWLYRLNKPIEALKYGKEALALAVKLKDTFGLADVNNKVGVVYRNLGDYSEALQHYQAALKSAQLIGNEQQMAYAYNNIGGIYTLQESYELAIENSEEAWHIFEKIKDQRGVSFCLINIGINYRKLKEYGKALENFEKCLAIRKTLKAAPSEILACYFQIGETYLEQKKYKQAKYYFSEAYVKQSNMNENSFSGIFNSIAIVYLREQRLDSALFFAKKALKTAQNSHNKERVKNAAKTLSQIHLQQNQFESAYEFLSLQMEYKDSLQSEENSRLLSNYTLSQKQQELDLANKEKRLQETELEEKRLERYVFILLAAFMFLLIAGFWVLARVRKQRNDLLNDTNEALVSKNEEILSQKEEIENQKVAIEKISYNTTSSIVYAKRIQEAVLPAMTLMNESLSEYFVWYLPRDIVSGDFYWFAEKTDKVIVIVGDCTGHGVPGAFMSMIGDSLLNQIVHNQEVHSPEQILEHLHRHIRHTLKQEETNSRDGMDIAILVLHKAPQKGFFTHAEYAGAMNPILYIAQNGIQEIKATKKPIGGMIERQNLNYQKHVIPIQESTTFYLFSDGLQDQFGGDYDKKFTTKRLRQLLQDLHHLPIREQKQEIEQTYRAWVKNGEYAQIDDILLWGIRISNKD